MPVQTDVSVDHISADPLASVLDSAVDCLYPSKVLLESFPDSRTQCSGGRLHSGRRICSSGTEPARSVKRLVGRLLGSYSDFQFHPLLDLVLTAKQLASNQFSGIICQSESFVSGGS